MDSLFKKRLGEHWIELIKYLKYVFNDFFVIALMFFIGALGFSYSNLLSELKANIWWEKPVIILVILISVFLGGMATLVKKPDRIFVSPMEAKLKKYFRDSFFYSFFMASIVQLVIWFVLLPFISISMNWKMLELVVVLILMLVLKGIILRRKFNQFYNFRITRFSWEFDVIGSLLILSVAVYFNSYLALFLATIWLAKTVFTKNSQVLNWNRLIESEDKRMSVIYRFFSLFKGVPEVSVKEKRRKWLDPIFKFIPQDHHNFYLNLYVRAFVRNGEMSLLYIRLLVIGFVILMFTDNQITSLIIYLLFIYLVGFQIIPFFNHFKGNIFSKVYPVFDSNQQVSFKKMITYLLFSEMVLLLIAMMLANLPILIVGLALLLGIVEIELLINPFLKNKIKKFNLMGE